ncbi:MAG: hypothetical protein SFZ03_02865 [Candidatus Melainabacteria bacterium]|nr:hypothetical protein [Candidatus Melainabacteria bacterium]
MTRQVLNHFSTYEWTGQFWFPETEEQKFFGKVTYSPEKGIQIELLTTHLISDDDLNKKLLYGAVLGEIIGPITLFNVSLNRKGTELKTCTRILKGTAGFLLQGSLAEKPYFDSLEIEYEKPFESIFLTHSKKEIEIRELLGKFSFSPETGSTISLIIDTWPTSILKIDRTQSSLQELFLIEDHWRSFWELMIDREVFPEHIWLRIPQAMPLPLLKNYYAPIKKNSEPFPLTLEHLPINILAYKKSKNNLSIIRKSLKKWFERKNDPKWSSVIYGIRRLIKNRRTPADRAFYVSLLYEIETFLKETRESDTKLEQLIKKYARNDWKSKISKLLTTSKDSRPLGKSLKEIRNVIVHPTSNERDRYLPIIQDNDLFQEVYAYLSGLFVKAVLKELDSIYIKNIKNYTNQFIEARRWRTVNYS